MSEIIYIDDWSALHTLANLSIGMFTGARHYNFWHTLAVVSAIGITWEYFEHVYPESNETMKDHMTDMLLNTLGFVTGYVLGRELKK